MQRADVVVLQGELAWTVTSAVADRVKDVNARLVLNLAPVGAPSDEVLALADPLIVNESEALDPARQVACENIHGSGGVEDALRGRCKSLVITRGGHGAFVADAHRSITVPAERVRVIDTTGAGDAFVGALAVSLTKSHDLAEVARFATVVAGGAVRAVGTMDAYPKWADLC